MKSLSIRSIAVIASSHAMKSAMPSSPWASAVRSTPVENARPAPVSATTRISGRSASVATAALRSRAKRASPALSTSGRSSVRRASAPAILPELARGDALADWQVGLVAGAFGFARMAADIPIGLFLAHHLRRAVVVGPCVLAVGVLVLTSGGAFPVLVLGRLLMGVGHALGMVGGLTAILRYHTGWSLASALNAYEFSAMIGILCGTALIGGLPPSLSWNRALLLTCAPQLLGIVTLPALVRTLARSDAPGPRPLFARQAAAGPDTPAAPITPAMVLAFVAGGAIAVAYSTVEQFSIPLRGSRELGLERAGVARLLVVMQVFDIAALLPLGVLADRRGTVPVLVAVLLVMAAASALVGFGTLPVVAAGCALYGLGMAGWMLPLGVLRRETPQEHVAWRTGLYRVCVDGGIFLGPFLAGLLGAGHARILTGVWAAALALTGLLFLLRERRRP